MNSRNAISAHARQDREKEAQTVDCGTCARFSSAGQWSMHWCGQYAGIICFSALQCKALKQNLPQAMPARRIFPSLQITSKLV